MWILAPDLVRAAIEGRLPHGMGVTRLADLPENGPASINCSDFLLSNHTVEPRLFEPKSLLPGNGILPTETMAPKRLRKTKETIAET
jgi:hypothetical protein